MKRCRKCGYANKEKDFCNLFGYPIHRIGHCAKENYKRSHQSAKQDVGLCDSCSNGRKFENCGYVCKINSIRSKSGINGFQCEDYQAAKQDTGKPRISLVPPEIIRAIAKVREYGTKKYGNKDNWKTVDTERFYDAFLRHVVASMGDMGAIDEESGLPHLHHAACNLAFILDLEKMGD